MTYSSDTAHCPGYNRASGFCPLLDCHRYWLHSEFVRRWNSGRDNPHDRLVYVEPQYHNGTCPNYIKHQ